MTGKDLEISGIESHNSNGFMERYHEPLRRIFNCIRRDYPKLDAQATLRIVIEGIHDTMSPEGSVPSVL